MQATAVAPSNIAFIKYWGKDDEQLHIPTNPSISMTLSDNVATTTTAYFSKDLPNDILVLNGIVQTGTPLDRVSHFLDLIRKKANTSMRCHVDTHNSFPTGSGMASSASGFAALTLAATKALGLELSQKELSALARQGSGSAARSIHGGIVIWEKSHAKQLYTHQYWPEIADIIIIVDHTQKKISSRVAMAKTKEKSKLFQKRLQHLPKRITSIKNALKQKSFETLARLIMQDSDEMHQCIEEIGVHYLTTASHAIKENIINLNKQKTIAAYTFDAGPNAHIITVKEHIDHILGVLQPDHYIISGIGNGAYYEVNS